GRTIGRSVWAWALALVVIALAAAPLVAYWLTNPEDQRLVDLDVYRTGGSAILRGLPLYDVITPAPQLLPFTYPPVGAMLAVPLAVISWPAAQGAWTTAIFVVLAVTVRLASRPLFAAVRTGPSVLSRPGGAAAVPLLLALLTVACT